MKQYYLKSNIKAEPLIWQWYAWPHLIAPHTAACNIVNRHLKIMTSYVLAPDIHAKALESPKSLGGPYIDFNGENIEEIKELIQSTENMCASLIKLEKSIKLFDCILQKNACGGSLTALYQQIPENLKGFIELVYDLNNHPSIRFIEPLLYKKYYSAQNEKIALSEMQSEFRKFILSTPRINCSNEVHLEVNFASKSLDQLFKMKIEPNSREEIEELFSIQKNQKELFQSFFTTIMPLLGDDRNYYGEGVRVRYFGHACILLQTNKLSILIDPVISYSLSNTKILRYTYNDLPDYIDYVILTHNHQDHFMLETLLQLRFKIGAVIFPNNNKGSLQDPSIKLILKHLGFSSLIPLDDMESVSLLDGEIIGLPFLGEHADLNIQTKLAYCVSLKGKKFVFAADSTNLDTTLYDHIFDWIGAIDFLFLGMECDGAPLTWLYGPLLTTFLKRSYDQERTLSGSDFQKAWPIVDKSQCKNAYVYAMGQEPWLGHIMALQYTKDSPQIIESDKFIRHCLHKGINSERLFGRKEWIL